jgi:hypothetical protein
VERALLLSIFLSRDTLFGSRGFTTSLRHITKTGSHFFGFRNGVPCVKSNFKSYTEVFLRHYATTPAIAAICSSVYPKSSKSFFLKLGLFWRSACCSR